jgi:hypothetical protein
LSGWNAPTAAAAQSPALNPAKIPIPPRLGVGASCQRSVDGSATSRRAATDRRSAQMTADAAGRAMTATAVLTAWRLVDVKFAITQHLVLDFRVAAGR